MDSLITHHLSCRISAGRIPRHSDLNDVVRRGLSAAGIPSMFELSDLDRGYGKRPHGITAYPYSRGRCLIWDATCVITYVSTNQIRAAFAGESVADAAEVEKNAKYAVLGRRFIFHAADFRHQGKINNSIFYRFGATINEKFQDHRESVFNYSQRERLQHFAGVIFYRFVAVKT